MTLQHEHNMKPVTNTKKLKILGVVNVKTLATTLNQGMHYAKLILLEVLVNLFIMINLKL